MTFDAPHNEMAEQIDAQQDRIDLFDQHNDNLVFLNSGDYTGAFITEVDAVVDLLEQAGDEETTNEAMNEILSLLSATTQENIAEMGVQLEQILAEIQEEVEAPEISDERVQEILGSQVDSMLQDELALAGMIDIIDKNNKVLVSMSTDMREEMMGFSGYLKGIEGRNILNSLYGSFTGGAETHEMQRLDSFQIYVAKQQRIANGAQKLKGFLRKNPEHDIVSAWEELKEHGDSDFAVFANSPYGQFFERAVINGEGMNSSELQAKLYFDKAMEMKKMVGPELAQPYFEIVLDQYQDSEFSQLAEQEGMSGLDKVASKATDILSVATRLDSLAALAVAGGANALLTETATGARVLEIGTATLTRFPTASKLLPGVNLVKGPATGLVGSTLRFGANLGIEMGKYSVYSSAAEAIGGEKAAYGVGMACLILPGFVSEFQAAIAQPLAYYLTNTASRGLKDLGTFLMGRCGGRGALRQVLKEGLTKMTKNTTGYLTGVETEHYLDIAMTALTGGEEFEEKAA